MIRSEYAVGTVRCTYKGRCKDITGVHAPTDRSAADATRREADIDSVYAANAILILNPESRHSLLPATYKASVQLNTAMRSTFLVTTLR